MIRVFNECDFAKKMLNEGFIKERDFHKEIKILGKYYKFLGKDEKQIEQDLISFCKQYKEGFNEITYASNIDRILKEIQKEEFYEIKSVKISISEINKIKELNDLELEKLMFVYLVLSKLYAIVGHNNFIKKKEKYKIENLSPYVIPTTVTIIELFGLAKLKKTKDEKFSMIRELYNKKYIDIRQSIRAICLISEEVKEGEYIEISCVNFGDFILEYLKFKNEKVGWCECCGKVVKINGQWKKYCNKCSIQVDKEKAKNRMKKIRENSAFEVENSCNH